MKYLNSFRGLCSLSEIKEWYIGESEYLKKLLGTGFENTIFISEGGEVEFYYDSKEVEKFEKALGQIDEEKFGEICTDFMLLIKEIPNCKTDEEKLTLFSKMVPALTIFYEFDCYPEYMKETMQRRLMRIRVNTETKPYELLKGIGQNDPKDFIYFKRKIHPIEFKDELLTKTL